MPGDQASWPPPGSRLRTSHTSLLVNCYDRRLPQSVDAIIVPSDRPVENLQSVIELATSLRRPLLVLSSHESMARQAVARMGTAGQATASGLAATVGLGALDSWLILRTSARSPMRAPTYADRSVKRNVGLLIARMMGWKRVLFLDDDIRDLGAEMIASAVPHVGGRGVRLAGWRARRFADNSVVCHALRAAGDRQDVFIGAGAFILDPTGWMPFFPAVYNEDWFFMHDFVTRREAGWVADVQQLPYSPFKDPERAFREEFGDVLAEGLWALIHEGRSVLVACLPGYWCSVIDERLGMLDHIERRLWRRRDDGHTHTWDHHEIVHIFRSLNAAREALGSFTPEDLAEYTSAWRHDLYLWNSRIPHLPSFSRITDALNWLGITDVHVT